jgi:hypothetical protein
MKKLFEFIKQSLSENNGRPSSTRLNVFYSFVQWAPAITFGFIWCLIYHPELVLAYLAILTTGVFGILGLKVHQKGKEDNSGGGQ